MEEGFDFEEMMTKILMDAGRKRARREAAQQAVERVVRLVGRFDGKEVPKFLRAYDAEMTGMGVDEATRLEFFRRAAAASKYEEVKELQEAHESWESFEGALMEAYGCAESEVRGRREFDRWVASARRHRSAIEAFREFERRFSQLSEWERRSVGADKVLLFLETVHHEERMDIMFELQDDYGAHGLTEEWPEVEWVCRQHEARRSATTRPASGGEERATTDYAMPPDESSSRTGLEGLDLQALIREACGLVMAKIEAEEWLIAGSGPSGSEDAEEGASSHMEDGAYAEAEREWYIGTTGEGAERATLSTCGERSTEDEVGDGEAAIADSSGHGGFGTWWPESSSTEETSGGTATFHAPVQETPAAGPSARVRPREKNGGGGKAGNRDNGKETAEEAAASITDACIYGGGVATDNDVRAEVATDITSTSGGPATLHASFLEITAAGPSARVRPMVKGGGGGKAGDHGVDTREGAEQATVSSRGKRTAMDEADIYGAMDATSRVGGSFGTRLPETFYEDFASILEACEMEEEDETSDGVATFHTPALEASAVGPSAGTRPRATDGGGGKADNRDEDETGEEEAAASILDACETEDGVATDDDVRMEVATDERSGGVATFHTPVLETPAPGPRAGERPRVTDGGGGKAGNRNDDDMGEGAERATLSSCGEWTAKDEAGDYKAESATSKVGGRFGARRPKTSSGEEASGGAATFHTPALEASAVGPSAGTRPRTTGGGGGKAGKQNDAENGEEEVVASILEAYGIGDGGAADNDVRTKAATETTSGGAGSLPTPILEAPMAGPSAGMRLSATGGDGGKAGNGNEKEDWSGRRQDPLTPGPETSAVVLECQRETGEMGGDREEVRPGESAYEDEYAGPGMGVYGGSDGEDRSGNEERVGNRPDRNTARKKKRVRAGEPGPNRRKPARPIGRLRLRLRLRWEPVSARWRLTGHDDHGSGEKRKQTRPSIPTLETTAVADQHKTGETAGGGEESEAGAYEVTGTDIRYEMVDGWVQDGEPVSERATATKEEKTDTEVGSTAEERDEMHAIRPMEGQDTSMPTKEPHRATEDDGRITPSRGEYEEEGGDDKTWHDAREDWWEEVAYGEAKTGGHEDKAREGSSTPAIETPAVGASADVRPRVADGGGEGTKATTDEGTERGIREVAENEDVCAQKNEHDITKDVCGRAGQEGQEGVPPSETEVGEERYLSERVREEERNAKRAMRPHEGQATSTGTMVCSTAREHGKQREGEKCVMGSSKDRSTSTHSEDDTDVRGKPTEGKRGARRVGTTRCAARKRRIRRICEADKGSATAFGRTDRGRKRGHRKRRSGCRRWFEETRWTWRIGWRQRLGERRQVWRIGWSRRFETIRRRWWAGRRRWFVWTGWTCSKWKTKPGKPTRLSRARLAALAENLAFCSPFGTYRWMCG